MRTPDVDVMGSVVQTLCERIDTPRSLAAWLCFKYDHEALLGLPMPPIAEPDVEKFQKDYFVTEYLSKYKGLKTSFNLRDVALQKWKLSEQMCTETNRRFKLWQSGIYTPGAEGYLSVAQRKIAAILGQLRPSLVLSDCKFGPGATFDLARGDAVLDKKISNPISVTASALPYIRAVIECDPHWAAVFLGVIPEGTFSLTKGCFRIVNGSRFLTVPKSAKTDRCIAAEPTGNSFLQQGVHSYMRRRLKRFGVDLDQQSISQERALLAFRSGLSTLDLSAASDTISRELIYHLLPLDWAIFLDKLRSPETLVDGVWIRTEKFASMGNAFCFELETLIFYALSSAVAESHGRYNSVTVYGDDIIVDRNDFDETVFILTHCGFAVNEKKSFKDGSFFESCGKHFFRGFEVTPVYQKEVLSHPSELIRAHNRLVRLASRMLGGTEFVSKALRVLANSYPLRPFPQIPYGASEDGGFLRPKEKLTFDKNRGYRCHVLDYVPRLTEVREDAIYAYKLRRVAFGLRRDLPLMPEKSLLLDNIRRLGQSPQKSPDPKGYCRLPLEGRWRTRVRWVPLASLGSF